MSWSSSMEIRNTADHYVESNYVAAYASWFQKNWWSTYDWGWIYTNDTSMPLKLKTATFSACAGHSNGKQYWGGSRLLQTYGYGCTFTSDIYVVDSAGNRIGEAKGVGICDIPSINTYNCYYGGYGNTSTSTDKTSFGNPIYFGPNTGYYADSNGVSRCREPKVITYNDAPAVPPGGKMFVVIRPVAWKTSGDNALLVMKGDESNFSAELEPEDENYIWICLKKEGDTSPKWYKERKAFARTNKGWEEL